MTNEEAWLAQDAALRNANDPADRLLAQALAQPALDPVPGNFAARVVLLAVRQPQPDDERIEMLLEYGLLGLLAALGLTTVWSFASGWLDRLLEAGSAPETGASLPGWFAIVLLCLALSAATGFFGPRTR